MAKPSGHTSPENVVVTVTIFTVIAFSCVLLRLWTRIRIIQQAGWDDLVVTLAMFFTGVFAVCIISQVHYGLGRHQKTLSAHQERLLLIWFWISVWNYYLGLGLAKLSIVLQCLRVFGHIPKFRKSAMVLGAVMFIFMWWTVFISMFLCQPVSYFWEPHKPGKCLNRLLIWFTNASFNIATDIATAILPLPVVKSLNLPRRQRYILMAVFGLGGIICLLTIIRFTFLYAIAVSDDSSWDNPLAASWALLEATVGIIASCLPTMKGLVMRYFPTLFTAATGTRGGDATLNLELGGMNKSESTMALERVRTDAWESQVSDKSNLGRNSKIRIHEIEKECSVQW